MNREDLKLAIEAIHEQVEVLVDVANRDDGDHYGGTVHLAATLILETLGDLISVNSGRVACVVVFEAANLDLHLREDGDLYAKAKSAVGRRTRRLVSDGPSKLRMSRRLVLQA